MSLKTVHLFFMATVLAMFGLTGYWAATSGTTYYWPLIITACAGGLADVGYFIWFVRRYASL